MKINDSAFVKHCTCDSARYGGVIHQQWCKSHPLYRAPYQPCSDLDKWLEHAKQCWPRPKRLRLKRAQAIMVLRDVRDGYAAHDSYGRISQTVFWIERGAIKSGFFGSIYGIDIELVQ